MHLIFLLLSLEYTGNTGDLGAFGTVPDTPPALPDTPPALPDTDQPIEQATPPAQGPDTPLDTVQMVESLSSVQFLPNPPNVINSENPQNIENPRSPVEPVGEAASELAAQIVFNKDNGVYDKFRYKHTIQIFFFFNLGIKQFKIK